MAFWSKQPTNGMQLLLWNVNFFMLIFFRKLKKGGYFLIENILSVSADFTTKNGS
jgi:hypothetical protein